MYLIAVSGGPDSIYLLNKYKNKKVVAAHVNYNKRKDSLNDQRIVEKFCQLNNIPLEVLNITTDFKNNFQSKAREARYQFFRQVYDKYNCKMLLTAHHKDDFIETALMQQQSGRTPRYFGIRQKNFLFDMYIYRPLIKKVFKSQILDYLNKHKIQFATDSSNYEPIFTRNKIRIELSKKSNKERQDIFEWFILSNKILIKKFRRVDKFVKKLKDGSSIQLWKSIKRDKNEIAYEFLHKKFNMINLSNNKIISFWDFVNGKDGGKTFIIDKNSNIYKVNKKLIYNYKNNI